MSIYIIYEKKITFIKARQMLQSACMVDSIPYVIMLIMFR